ncbi:MAG: threonine/serine dehydratase [Candidatus Dormiibacterota bacterium]
MDPAPSLTRALEIDDALRRLEGLVHRTPLLRSRLIDERAGCRVWFKAESFQRSGSFKARGAFNAALAGLEAGDRRGLVALSSGNHGQAVALAARDLGLQAVVVMAEGSSPVKVAAVRGYGAEVVMDGVTVMNREQVAANLAAKRDLRLLHPHDDLLVMAGQATVAEEVADQAREQDFTPQLVVVPVGGGGLLAGIATSVRRRLPGCRVVGVEPVAGDDGVQSMRAGRRISLAAPPVTAADGARTIHLGQMCWEIIRHQADAIVTATEAELAEALWWLWSRCKVVVEPTGALALAAVLSGSSGVELWGERSGSAAPADVVCVISGGNCEPQQVAGLLGEYNLPLQEI